MASTESILHVVPLNTGGVDRFVRDFCAVRTQDEILHVGDVNVVLERVALREHWVLPAQAVCVASLYKSRSRPRAIYAHSTLNPVRESVRALCETLAVPYVLSLHDIDFVANGAEEAEREDRYAFVRGAYARIAPSNFIAREARNALGVESVVIENGHRTTSTEFAPSVAGMNLPGMFDVAVVGALGEHKGLSFLRAVAAGLPENVRILHVGYSDGKLGAGWLVDQRVWSTGVFEPAELPGLLEGAAVRVAFFPNRQPESFSYALSDVWLAGLPAVVPRSGALGDRVQSTGAGWTYDVDASAESIARFVVDCLSDSASKRDLVHAAGVSLARVEQTALAVVACFPPSSSREANCSTRDEFVAIAPDPGSEWSVAIQLNTQLMRGEIRKLLGEIEFAETKRRALEAAYHELSANYEGRGEWISKLEADLAATHAANSSQATEVERLVATFANEHAESLRLQEKYEADIATLRSVIQNYESAIARTPYPFRPLLRRWLNRK